jgi:putative transposase
MPKPKPQRKTIRLKDYDYSIPGAYFVTICTYKNQFLFAETKDGVLKLNNVGEMIEGYWINLANKFPAVEMDEYIIMPDHLHGLIFIVGADPCVCPDSGAHTGAPLQKIIQWFKTMTTNAYIRGVKKKKWRPFTDKLWQRGYYEHIVRNAHDLNDTRHYIKNNPARWALKRHNP